MPLQRYTPVDLTDEALKIRLTCYGSFDIILFFHLFICSFSKNARKSYLFFFLKLLTRTKRIRFIFLEMTFLFLHNQSSDLISCQFKFCPALFKLLTSLQSLSTLSYFFLELWPLFSEYPFLYIFFSFFFIHNILELFVYLTRRFLTARLIY